MGVGRVVDVFVQLWAGSENRERQHEHGRPDRDEAVEVGGEGEAARHEEEAKRGETGEGAIMAESSRGA
jgi:hypothetical protein